mmetsp:Transcript_9739/g.27535  ORF Transcript_9739/g.27535 Transcript_9739/m.27535 type:complete len:222 (+) Transcript_9739:1182-1847(+)
MTAGFRRPARMSDLTSRVCVAENNPVRRCFGKRARMLVIVRSKPRSRRTSASSRTRTSKWPKLSDILVRFMMSSRRPGVATTMSMRLLLMRSMSSGTLVPPVKSWVASPVASAKGCATLKIWPASSRVGEMMMAPQWPGKRDCSGGRAEVSDDPSSFTSSLSLFAAASARWLRSRSSKMGSTNARVFPEPVQASTATSQWPRKRGRTAPCTGVSALNLSLS